MHQMTDGTGLADINWRFLSTGAVRSFYARHRVEEKYTISTDRKEKKGKRRRTVNEVTIERRLRQTDKGRRGLVK